MSEVQESPDGKTVCITSHSGRTLKYDHSGRSLWALRFGRPMGVRKLSVLSDLEAGGEAILVSLNLPASVSNHLMYMGFVPDARVKMVRRAPAGDPTVYAIDGMVVALRQETAKAIQVKPVSQIKPVSQTKPANEMNSVNRGVQNPLDAEAKGLAQSGAASSVLESQLDGEVAAQVGAAG